MVQLTDAEALEIFRALSCCESIIDSGECLKHAPDWLAESLSDTNNMLMKNMDKDSKINEEGVSSK